ncbi:hypothetical protein BLNAU_6403 [Blattamonas nauphoetae]|uniref:Uncharacterized protein n=1 Tax=Blattamonas nauphoetae TaxID=2049346 RepID=A0ABQ9Y4J2_9EUKA|nr:hypothetical protein BLNAU_6403 [Blattamonas nauphoetae]
MGKSKDKKSRKGKSKKREVDASTKKATACRVTFFVYIIVTMVVLAATLILGFIVPTGEAYYTYIKIFSIVFPIIMLALCAAALVSVCCSARHDKLQLIVVALLVGCDSLFMPFIHAAAYGIISSTMHKRYLIVDTIKYDYEFAKKYAGTTEEKPFYDGKCNSHRYDATTVENDSTFLIVISGALALCGILIIIMPTLTQHFLIKNRTRKAFAISGITMQIVYGAFLLSDVSGSTVFGKFDSHYQESTNKMFSIVFIIFMALHFFLGLIGLLILFLRHLKCTYVFFMIYRALTMIVEILCIIFSIVYIVVHIIVYIPGRNNRPTGYTLETFSKYYTNMKCSNDYCTTFCSTPSLYNGSVPSPIPCANRSDLVIPSTCAEDVNKQVISFHKSAWHANQPANAVAYAAFTLIFCAMILGFANFLKDAFKLKKEKDDDDDDDDSNNSDDSSSGSSSSGSGESGDGKDLY